MIHIIFNSGREVWYNKNGYYDYREDDGPSVIYPNGSEEWRKYGKLYRKQSNSVLIDIDGNENYVYNNEPY